MPGKTGEEAIRPVLWKPDEKILTLLDQTLLPEKEVYREYIEHRAVAEAIGGLVVRGAPAIGCASAFGLVLASLSYSGSDPEELAVRVSEAADLLTATRPTAVNLSWAVERMKGKLGDLSGSGVAEIRTALEVEAVTVFEENLSACLQIGNLGADLIPARARVFTHCNAGALATAGYGTALGVIRSAFRQGKVSMVWIGETRPVLQGARLTAWEMLKEGIPATLLTDSAAGALMAAGEVDFVVVGADRIVGNGDIANKIGTYALAVLAQRHDIPFIVAAPISTVDMSFPSGEGIPIEERDSSEVAGFGGIRWAPRGISISNPAFDVTPAELITAIVTEKGVLRPPFGPGLKALFSRDR